MITIIFAPPRYGKTVLMTHLLNQIMYDRERWLDMRGEIMQKNAGGFNLTVPTHCVAANYTITGWKVGFSRKKSYHINPYRLGFANDYVDTHFTPPYMAIGITEGQKYFNSRLSRLYPDWQSRWYEQHGHNYMDIFIDVQRPQLIDINIRELAQFIEVIRLDKKYDSSGNIIGCSWLVRKFESSYALDSYLASGKKNAGFYTEETITADYNVFECYDSRMCKPKFYDRHFNQDFDLKESAAPEETLQGYMDYLFKYDDEKPPQFYMNLKGATQYGFQ